MAVTEHAQSWAPARPRPAAAHPGGPAVGAGEGTDRQDLPVDTSGTARPPVQVAGPAAGTGTFDVQGVIPAELDGALVRIGPARRPGRPLVCGIRIDGGAARRLTLGDLPGEMPAADPAAGVRVVARTARFTVLYDPPVAYSRAAELMGDPVPYRPHGRPARAGLRARGGVPQWFTVEPWERVVNAFEDGDGRVVADVVSVAGTRRWTLDPRGGAGGRTLRDAPRVAVADPRTAGRPHQVLFGLDAGGQAVVTCDLAAGTRRVRRLRSGLCAETPVFVPRGRAEGDGRLLVPVHDHTRRRAELLILDAMNPAASPEAVITLPFLPPPADRVLWLPAGHD
ncbi:hypothetical protein GCM10009677_55910 [Sphaerisporangium rubeum]|uniref:Dioxygenase n=1 Tax=Sphaerisporangium rubeum TaxID=321317 RepID=A0A7X0IEU4_9ACTN|nr:carotenoid oxygenase family protein [Sphaerisporangium rubeum]MBB6473851.1 carotenoid cleavage dioxygenase-like enzyme [Sphaerisporangium rubeum]